MKIIVTVELPDERVHDFFQHLRNFDTANPGCKFMMIANAPNKTVEEIAKILDVQPPLQMKKEIKS
jgi:hypothetical protein